MPIKSSSDFCIPGSTLGYVAGTCTSLAFLPQVWNVYKNKSAKGLSIVTLVVFFIGQILWVIHGHLDGDSAVMGFAILTAVLYIFLIYAKIEYK